MTDDTHTASSWWGNFNFEIDQSRLWQIGPLTLIVRRMQDEWQIAHQRNDDFEDDHLSWEVNDTDLLPESLEDNARYIFQDESGQLNIKPILADRSIISRPLTPFILTAGEEIKLYVSSSLWLELSVGTVPQKVLSSVAIQRPSDTWFGPSTLEGELCYASATHCRLHREQLPQRPYRAMTPVLIRNQASTNLVLERLNLPVTLLPLYASVDNQLWTSQITLIREKDGDMAALRIEDRPPAEVERMRPLSEARNNSGNGVLLRAFNAVFS